MVKKLPVIAAEHTASGVPPNARQSGQIDLNATTGNIPTGALRASRHERATLIASSKKFFAQSADFPEPPHSYDKDKYYRIQLVAPVQDHAGNWLRPSQDVMVIGSFAQTISALISGAIEV